MAKYSIVWRWKSREEICKGSVENSIVMAADSNVLALQRTAMAERCDDLLWNSIVLSAKALYRPELLRQSI